MVAKAQVSEVRNPLPGARYGLLHLRLSHDFAAGEWMAVCKTCSIVPMSRIRSEPKQDSSASSAPEKGD